MILCFVTRSCAPRGEAIYSRNVYGLHFGEILLVIIDHARMVLNADSDSSAFGMALRTLPTR
jgi:hypothetical protein